MIIDTTQTKIERHLSRRQRYKGLVRGGGWLMSQARQVEEAFKQLASVQPVIEELVKQLALVQTVTEELVKQGFSRRGEQ